MDNAQHITATSLPTVALENVAQQPSFIEQLPPEKKQLIQDLKSAAQKFDHIGEYEYKQCLSDVTLFRYLDGYEWNLETGRHLIFFAIQAHSTNIY